MSRISRLAASVAATAVVIAPAFTGGAAHADASLLPHADPFYNYTADGKPGTPPADSKPGDPIGAPRTVTLPVMADLLNSLAASNGSTTYKTFSINATQLLYRTQDERGQASETVTTVIQPKDLATPVQSKGVVAYLSFYDGLSDTCDPSYTLQNSKLDAEKAAISQLVEAGYTVTIPDFEGEGLDWAAGHEAGWSTLDAIRATEKTLDLPAATTKVATIGYSGGSIAGEWAAELQPTYAPELHLVGTAIGGVPVNLRHLVGYVDSAADTDRDNWFGVIPAATVSLGRATGQDFSSLLSDYGKQVAAEVSDKCIADFAGTYPGKHLADLVNPGVSFLDDPKVKPIVDSLTMGNGATPSAPMLMMNGRSSDGIGDGVMVADDVKALAANYCSRGVPVQYTEVAGKHAAVGSIFMLTAIGLTGQGFLSKWFDGTATPADYNCAPRVLIDPAPLRLALAGHSQGRKDVIAVKVSGYGARPGLQVRVFRAGHKAAVGHAALGKSASAVVKVRDLNGNGKTRYIVTVAGKRATITLR
jgi:hypothetical protein